MQNLYKIDAMTNRPFPFAVRLIGFSEQEEQAFDAAFATGQGRGYGYLRLDEDNLLDPDMYIANADELTALVALNGFRPTGVRPALLVGTPSVDLPFPRVPRPLDWGALFEALDRLVEARADALSQLQASDIVVVPERRRRPRLDLDLTDPAVYEKMRAKIPEDGAVLVVDRNAELQDFLSARVARYGVTVACVADEAAAVDFCNRQSVALVLINVSAPGVDPYRLCQAIKAKDSPLKIAVVFLIGSPFVYDARQARYVGAEGYLQKPLAGHHLITVLKKYLPRVR